MPKNSCTEWRCRSCKKVMRGAIRTCACDGSKQDGTSLESRPGDWMCRCQTNNFMRRSLCWECGRWRFAEETEEEKKKKEEDIDRIVRDMREMKEEQKKVRKQEEEEKKGKEEKETEERWAYHEAYPDPQEF